MELFDKRFVHFMWDDELKGKTGIVSNDIKCLRDYVNNKSFDTELIEHSNDESQPFKTTDGIKFRFAYYDPNYEVKRAFNEGKKVQMKVDGFWANCDNPDFEDGEEYRVKPEEEKCLNDATLRALRAELKLDKAEHDKYSHGCFRCDAIKSKNNTIAQMQEQMEQMAHRANMQNETIIKLTLQLEKMKCCMNCKFYDFDEPKYCHKGVFSAYICDKWELNEEEMKWRTENN